MTVWPLDSPFQKIRIGSNAQHLRIVIALQKNPIKRFDDIGQSFENMSQIGEDAESPTGGFHDKSNSVGGVMRRRDRFNTYILDMKNLTGSKMANLVEGAEGTAILGSFVSRPGHIQREVIFALEDAGTSDMIRMIVRNDYGVDLPDIPPISRQPLFRVAPWNAGIEKKSHILGFNINTIAVAAGLEGNRYDPGFAIVKQW